MSFSNFTKCISNEVILDYEINEFIPIVFINVFICFLVKQVRQWLVINRWRRV